MTESESESSSDSSSSGESSASESKNGQESLQTKKQDTDSEKELKDQAIEKNDEEVAASTEKETNEETASVGAPVEANGATASLEITEQVMKNEGELETTVVDANVEQPITTTNGDQHEQVDGGHESEESGEISNSISKDAVTSTTDKDRKRSRSPRKRKRSRSPSRERRRRRSHSRKRSGSRSARRRSRSHSRGERKRKNRSHSRSERSPENRRRRSESIERRREERKRRHAEIEKREEEKRDAKHRRREENSTTQNSNDTSKQTAQTSETTQHNDNASVTDPKAKITERQRRTVDLLTSRTGGAYIPPAKLRLMQAEITDKASAAYQRIAWEALKKSIHGYINKVNVDNIAIITRELLKENIVRGRGLLCRSIIQAQAASPTFTHVYAALVSIINSKFPNIGELLLKRLVIQFKRAFRRNDKAVCMSSSRFIAHLVNQRVAHEILALEILTLLVETPTDDSVEVAIGFLKECGMKLTEVTSKGIGAIFEMLKNILHEGKLEKRVQYMIEVVFQVRKDGFKDHQSVVEALELVEEDDQFTHLMMLDEANDTEDLLNVFKFDEQYQDNEEKYKGLSKEILGSDASDSGGSGGSESDTEDSSDSDAENDEKATAGDIIDNTETNLIALRRTIYLTINSSLDYEECAHKLMKMQLKPGQEIELCHMFLDCCAEQRTYEKFYGLLAQRFCTINRIYIEPFEQIFQDTYQTTHRLDTNRLRNVSKFFAHLLFTDAIGWDVLDCIKLNEDDTTSSSRIFIKILFQELAEYMGLGKLNKKLKEDVLVESLAGLFPKDNPRNTRFAINFFTSIGLGGLTDELRHFLKNAPKSVPAINVEILASKPSEAAKSASSSSSSSSTSGSSSESSSSSSSSTSSSESESSESEVDKKKRKRKKKKEAEQRKKRKTQKPKESKKKKPASKQRKRVSSDESSGNESDSESSSSSSDTSSSSSSSSSEDEGNRKKLHSKSKRKKPEEPKKREKEESKRSAKREDAKQKLRDNDRRGYDREDAKQKPRDSERGHDRENAKQKPRDSERIHERDEGKQKHRDSERGHERDDARQKPRESERGRDRDRERDRRDDKARNYKEKDNKQRRDERSHKSSRQYSKERG